MMRFPPLNSNLVRNAACLGVFMTSVLVSMGARAEASPPAPAPPVDGTTTTPSAGATPTVSNSGSTDGAQPSEKKTQDTSGASSGSDPAKSSGASSSDYSSALASFDSKKFIKYGVTAGFAVNVQVASANQKSTAITTMPYLMLVPAYWVLGDVQAGYCSIAYGDDSAAALSAAKAYATKKAEDSMSVGQKKAYDAITAPPDVDIDKDADVDSPQTKEGWIKKKTGWNITKGGRCGYTHLGLFIGKPLAFDANAKVSDSDSESKRSITGIAAFGVGYLPNANVTLLFGVSYNSIVVPGAAAMGDTPATQDTLKNFWTPMVGFGGNVDLLTALFK